MDATSQHFIQVNLQNKVDIAKTLSRVVSTSFGPSCLQTMLTTSTGAVVVTSQGIAILKSLQISHPVGRVIVDAVSTHHKTVGDATKTLILLLEHSLLAVQDVINKQAGSHLGSTNLNPQMNNYLSNKIALALGSFSNTILSEVFIEAQRKADVIGADSCMHVLKNKMSAVLRTTFSSHLSSVLSKLFATLIMDSIVSKTELQSLESLKQRVEFMVENFEFMHVKSSGHAYRESSTISGFLLQRNFAFLSDHLSKKKIRCVLLRCPVEGISLDDKATMRLKSDDSFKAALKLRLNNTKIFLQVLTSCGVTLILSTEKVPEYVLSLCKKFDISVICYLEEEDIMFVEKISGKFSIHSTWDLVDDSFIINVSECCRVPIGNQIFVELSIENKLPKQLILCSPTDSMCHQLGNIVYKAYKSLLLCFQQNYQAQKDGMSCNTSAITIADKNLTSSSICVSNHSVEGLLDNFANTSDVNNSLNNSPHRVRPAVSNGISLDSDVMRNEISLDGSDVGNETSLVSGALVRNEISLDGSDVGNETSLVSGALVRNEISLDGHIKISNIPSTLTFVTIPGGGYFEYLIAELLDERVKSCLNDEISWCCRILAKSLRAIPFVIHKNLSHSVGVRAFLDKDKQIRDMLQNNCAAGFNIRGHVCDPTKEDIVEPLCAKFAVVCNVIQLLQQLLKVDGIVGVKTMQTKPDETFRLT